MSKVITFSRVFPAYHPKKGQPTYFIEKIYAGIADSTTDFKIPNDANDYWDMYKPEISEHKQYYGGDDKSENYGIYMGQIVKIDYADLDENWGEDFKNKL